MKYIPSVVLIVSAFVFAYYSHWSIKRNTNSIEWHLLQWGSVFLFLAGGFASGVLIGLDLTFHNFGDVVKWSVLGIPAYVTTLHFLNKKYNKTERKSNGTNETNEKD